MPRRPALSVLLSFLLIPLTAVALRNAPNPVLCSTPPSGQKPPLPGDGGAAAPFPRGPGRNAPGDSVIQVAAHVQPLEPGQSKGSLPDSITPPSAFAGAEEGETLEEVAARVYGSPAYADQLWQSNRDLLPSRAGVLKSGQPLRTPPIRKGGK